MDRFGEAAPGGISVLFFVFIGWVLLKKNRRGRLRFVAFGTPVKLLAIRLLAFARYDHNSPPS